MKMILAGFLAMLSSGCGSGQDHALSSWQELSGWSKWQQLPGDIGNLGQGSPTPQPSPTSEPTDVGTVSSHPAVILSAPAPAPAASLIQISIDPNSTARIDGPTAAATAVCGTQAFTIFGRAPTSATLVINIAESFTPTVGSTYALAPYSLPVGVSCVAGQIQAEAAAVVGSDPCTYDLMVSGLQPVLGATLAFRSVPAQGSTGGPISLTFAVTFADATTLTGELSGDMPVDSGEECDEGDAAL